MTSRAREMRGADKTQRVLEAVFRTLLRYHASTKVKCYIPFSGVRLSQMQRSIWHDQDMMRHAVLTGVW